MKKVLWVIVPVAIMLGIAGCAFFGSDNDKKDNPTSPAVAAPEASLGLPKWVSGPESDGETYDIYNGTEAFGVQLPTGCWIIFYTTTNGASHTAVANVPSGGGIANIGLSTNLGGIGPVTDASVAPVTGTCPVSSGSVESVGTGTAGAVASAPSYDGSQQATVIANSSTGDGDISAPSGSGSKALSSKEYKAVTTSVQ